jgi:hypothetical protein
MAAMSRAEVQPPGIPTSPEGVNPIGLGDTIPDVTLTALDMRPLMLREVVAQQPTVLVFYRGGW